MQNIDSMSSENQDQDQNKDQNTDQDQEVEALSNNKVGVEIEPDVKANRVNVQM